MIYGYARASTNEDKQDINRQIRELKDAGAQDIRFEYEHGDSAVKPQLSLLLETVNEGDTILTLEVSRLARSTKQLCDLIDKVKEKKICLDILGSIKVDCSKGTIDPMTNAFIQMSGVFAELELMIIRERVKSGMANAKAKGTKIGRPKTTKDDIPAIFYKHYPMYQKGDLNISEYARLCNLSRASIYKYLSLLNK
ncbi:MAG: recombinase family protein [Erysipelotrichaceae bacterium]|nr:recombinase family protein [Erysipelotrichaceae bacterium]